MQTSTSESHPPCDSAHEAAVRRAHKAAAGRRAETKPHQVQAARVAFGNSVLFLQGGTCSMICEVHECLEKEIAKLKPGKLRMQKQLQDALEASKHEVLPQCRLEVTGSVSWGGEVPQSDLDMMLCTPEGKADGSDAISLLLELSRSLEQQATDSNLQWDRLELLRTARVPILRVQNSDGCCCDIAVDQLRALHHRDFLLKTLEGRPRVRSFIRLIKFWVRQRGLPLSCEGGIPSLAWVFVALCLAEEQPEGASLEALLMHFFSQLWQLGAQCLHVVPHRAQGLRHVWQIIESPNQWKDEWTTLLNVADPYQDVGEEHSLHSTIDCLSITPARIPTALGLLYISELRLAWQAINNEQWHKLWRPASIEARLPLSSVVSDLEKNYSCLHIVLKKGAVVAGCMQGARRRSGLQEDESLHRRDHTTQLTLQPCGLGRDRVMTFDEQMQTFRPHHWICTLPLKELGALQGDALSRVIEIAKVVGSTSAGLQALLAVHFPGMFGYMQMPMYCVGWVPVAAANMTASNRNIGNSTNEVYSPIKSVGKQPGRAKGFKNKSLYHNMPYQPESNDTFSLAQASNDTGEAGSDESTRASDNEEAWPRLASDNEKRSSRKAATIDDARAAGIGGSMAGAKKSQGRRMPGLASKQSGRPQQKMTLNDWLHLRGCAAK